MAESVSGHKRKGGEEEEEKDSPKRVKGLDDEEEEKKDPEEGGILKSYPPEDLCNVTVETDKGWKIKCHQADLFRFPNSQVFRTMFDKETATISVPSSYFLDAKEFVEFFDAILQPGILLSYSILFYVSEDSEKRWQWVKRRFEQLNFFGLDTHLKKLLDTNAVSAIEFVSAEQAFYLGRTYQHVDFLRRAAEMMVESPDKCGDLDISTAVTHLGPQLLAIARKAHEESKLRRKLMLAARRAINVFTDTIHPEESCDNDECPKTCNGDSDEHPLRDHFTDTEDGDYDGDAFTALGKVHAILDSEALFD